jgi:hypothetical protein
MKLSSSFKRGMLFMSDRKEKGRARGNITIVAILRSPR